MSGPRYCNNYNEINDDDIYKLLSTDNDISRAPGPTEGLEPRGSRNLQLEPTYPVVVVESGQSTDQGRTGSVDRGRQADYRTILAGVPANFGLNITGTTKVSQLGKVRQNIQQGRPSSSVSKCVHINYRLDPPFNFRWLVIITPISTC